MVEDKLDKKIDKLRQKLSLAFEQEVFCPPKAISTGVIAFDEVTNGGLPEGRITELFGDYSSGKSLLIYSAIANLQRQGGIAVLVDTEDALNVQWAEKLGIDMEKLIYVSPALVDFEVTVEYVFKLLDDFVTEIRHDQSLQDRPVIFAWDSVAATKSAEEGLAMEYKSEMALRARVISQLMRKVPSVIAGTRIALVMVNQLRDKPGVLYGIKEDTPGGRAIKFHAHLRVMMKKGNKVKVGKDVVGMEGTLSVEKSKVGRPFRFVNFRVDFDDGIWKYSGLKDLLVREGVVTAAGAGWCKIGNYRFREIDDNVWQNICRVRNGENIEGEDTGEAVPLAALGDTDTVEKTNVEEE